MNFRNHNFINYTTRALGMIVQDGINRAYEHYFFQNAQRELSKRLRKRNKFKNI